MNNIERFNELLNTTDVGVAILNIKNLNNFFYTMNDTLKEYFMYDEYEINKLTLNDITYYEDLSKTKQSGYQVLNGELPSITYEKRYIRKDSSIFWGLVTLTRISDCFLLYVIKDITAHKQIQKDIMKILSPLTKTQKNEYCRKIKKQIIAPVSNKDDSYFTVEFQKPINAKIYLQQRMLDSLVTFSPTDVKIIGASAINLCFLSDIVLPKYEDYHVILEFKLLGKHFELTGDVINDHKVDHGYEYNVGLIIDENMKTTLINVLNNVAILNRNSMNLYDTSF